jgi:hypothetical protein
MAEEVLSKARDDLAAREHDLREKAGDLKQLADGIMKREDELAAKEKEVERKENELLSHSSSAAAAAIESRTRALDDREKKISSDARNLKAFAEQLMKKEEEYNIRVRGFNEEAEALLRGRVEELARREKDAARKDQDAKVRVQETARREDELARREAEASERLREALKREDAAMAAGRSDGQLTAAGAAELESRQKQLEGLQEALGRNEDELRAYAEKLALREKEAARKDQEATARVQETARREVELAGREAEASEKLQEALKKEEAATAAGRSGAQLSAAGAAEFESRQKQLDELREALGRKEEELRSRTAHFASHEEQLRAMEDELKRREEEWKAFSQQAAAKDRELKAHEEEIRKKEQDLSTRASSLKAREEELAAKGAMAIEKAALDDHKIELDAKGEENRIRGKELKIREDELERRIVDNKEREERLARLFSGAGAAGPSLTEEDRQRILNDLEARDREFQTKQAAARTATVTATEEIEGREKALAEREAHLQLEIGNLKSLASGYLGREAELKSAQESMARSMETLAGKEQLVKELDDRTQVLADRERAVEQFNQELLALDAMLQKKNEEQTATEKLLMDRAEALERDSESLESEKEQLTRDIETQRAETVAMRARAAEIEGAQREFSDKEALLKSEEEKIARLSAEVNKNIEEIQALEKDLKHKEIHLLTLEEEIKDCPYCSAKDGFVTTMQAIAEARALGADVTDAERLFKQANIALETSSYDGAVQYNRKAMVLAREAKQKYLVHGVSYILAGARRAVQSAAKLGVDVTDSEALLESARTSLEKKDYENAEQLARKAERTAILAEDKSRELLDRLDRIGKRLDEISAYGVDLGEAQAAVQAAREFMKEKKQADARLAIEGVEEMSFLAFRRQATKLMEESRESITGNKSSGLDLGDAELFLAKAEERLAEGDYGKCIQCSREAIRLASEARPFPAEGQAVQDGAAGRRGRTRPRVVAATVRVLTPGAGSPTPVITPISAAPQLAPASQMDQAPRGIPLQIPPGGGMPKDYQCPTCRGYFTVQDPRRPVLTKCPSCTNMVRLA